MMGLSRTELFIFIVGAMSRVSVKLIGDLYLSEILLALVVLARLRTVTFLMRNRLLKSLLALAALWLFAQIVTDLYRETPFEDWTRGWAKIIFFMIDLLGVAVLTRCRMQPAVVLSFGMGVAFLLQSVFFPNYAQGDGTFADGMWKFGVGAFFGASAAALCTSNLLYRAIGKTAEYLPVMIIGFVNLAMNSRSAFGIAVAASLAGAATQFCARQPALHRRISPLTFVIALGLAGMCGKGIVAIYEYAASNDWLGEAARSKYIQQTSGDLSLIQAGRIESLASIEAIADSPILGHGSWAKDEKYIVNMYVALANTGNRNYSEFNHVDDFTIPTHSHFLGAWVEAGFVGGVFWAYCAILAFFASYRTLTYARLKTVRSVSNTRYCTFNFLTIMGFEWSILFSPFANSARVSEAAVLIVIVAAFSPDLLWPQTRYAKRNVASRSARATKTFGERLLDAGAR